MNKLLIQAGITLAIIGLIVGLIIRNNHLSGALSRQQQSFYAERYATDQERWLTNKQLAELYQQNEGLQKQLALKPNQITRWLKGQVSYQDTGSIQICYDTLEKLVYPDKLHLEFDTPCYELDVYLNKGVASYHQQGNDTISCILYQERKHKLWFIRWGWKAEKAALYSSCRDSVYKVFDHVRNERTR